LFFLVKSIERFHCIGTALEAIEGCDLEETNDFVGGTIDLCIDDIGLGICSFVFCGVGV
jgi:hypothetical protein